MTTLKQLRESYLSKIETISEDIEQGMAQHGYKVSSIRPDKFNRGKTAVQIDNLKNMDDKEAAQRHLNMHLGQPEDAHLFSGGRTNTHTVVFKPSQKQTTSAGGDWNKSGERTSKDKHGSTWTGD